VTTGDRDFDLLIEQSQDLHTDAMSATNESLAELVELGQERRAVGTLDLEESRLSAQASRESVTRGLAAGGGLAAAAFGAALLGLTASAAFADTPTDIQMLQTSASIENLAVLTYKTALGLPYIGGTSANGVVKAFAQTTMGQHAEHAQAFNSAATALGGKAQTAPDPKYLPVVNGAVGSITKDSPSAGALAVIGLAITLENVAAETYVANCSKFSDTNSKKITASIMGVEAQHVATLLAVQALLKAGAPQLIALSPTVVAGLPAAAASASRTPFTRPAWPARPAKEPCHERPRPRPHRRSRTVGNDHPTRPDPSRPELALHASRPERMGRCHQGDHVRSRRSAPKPPHVLAGRGGSGGRRPVARRMRLLGQVDFAHHRLPHHRLVDPTGECVGRPDW
jgi:hypothetical protein